MTPTLSTTQTTLDAAALKLLANVTGPCITILIPEHHPGGLDGSRRALLRDFARTAAERLPADLVGPLENIAADPEFLGGGPAVAIFRAPEFTSRHFVPQHRRQAPHQEKLVIAGHFYLTPFLEAAFTPQEFFILALDRKHLRFLKYLNGVCTELSLPPGVPESLEAAEGFDRPDHDLENRSSAGPSTGAMRGVRFGTSSDHEAAGEYLAHFLGLVDRGLKPVLAGKPLLLLGVHEQIAAYRRVAKYGSILVPEITGNGEFLSLGEIAANASDAAAKHYHLSGERVLADFQEMTDRQRTLDNLAEVVKVASEGRVHRLCVRAVISNDNEELVNAAVIGTLRAGGEIFVLPEDRMPGANPVAAILRY